MYHLQIFYAMNLLHQVRSFMYIKNKSGPSTDPCGPSDFIFLRTDV